MDFKITPFMRFVEEFIGHGSMRRIQNKIYACDYESEQVYHTYTLHTKRPDTPPFVCVVTYDKETGQYHIYGQNGETMGAGKSKRRGLDMYANNKKTALICINTILDS